MKKFLLKHKDAVLLILSGMAAGAVNGFFGGGAGLLLVPLLKRACRVPIKETHATSVAVIFVLSVVTVTVYILRGQLPGFFSLLPFIIGGALGGAAGGIFMKRIPKKLLKLIFASFMILAGGRMLLG